AASSRARRKLQQDRGALRWEGVVRRRYSGPRRGRRPAKTASRTRGRRSMPEATGKVSGSSPKDGIDTQFCQSDNAPMKSVSAKIRITRATKRDVPLIRQLILELAEYERAQPGEAPVTEEDLAT